MGQPVLLNGVFQRLRDVPLANEIIESLGAIFAGENLIAHFANLVGSLRQARFFARESSLRSVIERWTLGVQRWTFSFSP